MHNTRAMSFDERIGDLDRIAECLVKRERTFLQAIRNVSPSRYSITR